MESIYVVYVYELRSYSINACTNVQCKSKNELPLEFFDRFSFLDNCGDGGGRLKSEPSHYFSIQNSDQTVQQHIPMNWLIALASIFGEFPCMENRLQFSFMHLLIKYEKPYFIHKTLVWKRNQQCQKYMCMGV